MGFFVERPNRQHVATPIKNYDRKRNY